MKTALLFLLACAAVPQKTFPRGCAISVHSLVKSDYPAKVTMVELLQEERLAVDTDGKRVMTERRVVKILRSSPHAPAAFREYNTKAGRIRDFRAWLLLPSGKEIEYTKDRIVDVAMTNDKTPYDEERAKVIECDKDSPPGSIFAYEVTEEESTIFTTHPYLFQEADPVLVSRFVLSLPPSWEARGTLFNHADVQPKVEGNTFTWELHDLPPMADEEEHSPRFSAIAPRLGVTYFPTNARKAELVPLKDWHSVSAWQAGFADPSAEATPAIHAKSDELTSQAKTEIEKIRAIAAFVQQTNYVSVDLNIMHGGGYIPHPASQVLAKNYGDCKDKAALMRALLKAAGVDSYEVAIYSGDRHFVRPEWPSAMQFNHAIVAVKVSPRNQSSNRGGSSKNGPPVDLRSYRPRHARGWSAPGRARQLRAGGGWRRRRPGKDASTAGRRQSHRTLRGSGMEPKWATDWAYGDKIFRPIRFHDALQHPTRQPGRVEEKSGAFVLAPARRRNAG